jgi:phosphatidylethanolamine-binding protein (PEBP) family uncharacterized protein
LSGSLAAGIECSPDAKRISYLGRNPQGNNAGTELWAVDAATGEHKVLVNSCQFDFPGSRGEAGFLTRWHRAGVNIRKVNGYQPPCPPPGAAPHHYIFEIYALDTTLALPAGSPRADLLKAMDGHLIGKATSVVFLDDDQQAARRT